ncbi:thiosulfate oxidation carrier protein SoxY [Polynucleobacter kasalickyi]|uniref:Thiosulfate-binding protein SoxY n=1 Tax=Polynucleobacter kasalickyi TaxID=1938817 RepID=A0A1W1Y853_9BURK|nr:thiosulfate oxidation carrier protein SoxY [Polynucleobacter kasalickyi]SMC32336.1 thiosulfate-binding protein SoxY [Polynucleobacter kasalickyi]
MNRRELLKMTTLFGLMASSGLITQAQANEWEKQAFEGKSLDDVVKALGGGGTEKSSGVNLTAPDIAENGAVVPIVIATTLKASQMAIIVEKNPTALSGIFYFPEGAEPFVSTRVKMAQTSNVYALVKADQKWYIASKEVKVTLGGCGG